MLDVQLIRSDLDGVATRLATRGVTIDIAEFRALEEQRKHAQVRTQELQAKRNASSKLIGDLKRKGEDTSALMAEMAAVGDELKSIEADLDAIQAKLTDMLLGIPNLPHMSVPVGKSSEDNVEVRREGEPRRFDFPVKDHVDVGAGLGMLDFDAAAKISGARFTLMKGPLARLHRAIAHFMLDIHTGEHGYMEVYVPYLVNADSMRGTGQLPKFEEDLFAVPHADGSKFYLIPTAEVPVTNIVRDEIVRGGEVAAEIRLSLAVFPVRGRLLRQGHPRHDPAAPVRQGRTGADRPSGTVVSGTGGTDHACGDHSQTPGLAVSHRGALYRRHGIRGRKNI